LSKLFNLKEWLTVKDAARHLSILFGEDVTDADILRLGLDGKLKLSVHLVNHANAQKLKIVSVDDATFPSYFDSGTLIVVGDIIGKDEVLVSDGDTVSVGGIFDLPMIGAETLDVEHEFQRLTGGPEVTLICLDGALIQDGGNTYWKLQERFGTDSDKLFSGGMKERKPLFFPAAGLPTDSHLVVRRNALKSLVESVDDAAIAKSPLMSSSVALPSKRGHAAFLRIIGGLVELLQDKRPNAADTSSATKIIKALVDAYGDKDGISERNLQTKFAEAKRSLED
jgi:hypothetical protein